MIIWSVANQKGGVGKTTTTVTLAGLLKERGNRVLLVDTDPHASLTTYLGFDADEIKISLFDIFQQDEIDKSSVQSLICKTDFAGLDIIPAHMSLATLDRVMGNRNGMGLVLKRAIDALEDEYDYALIDCPPILGVMMVNALAASTRVLIPVQTEFLAMKGLERMMRTLKIMKKSKPHSFSVTVVPTMYDKRTRASLTTLQELKVRFKDYVWPSAIPIDTKFRDASLKRMPPSYCSAKSRGVVAYQSLLTYLLRSELDDN